MILRKVFINVIVTFSTKTGVTANAFGERSCPSSAAYELCGADCSEEYFNCVIDCADDLFCTGDCVRSEAACRQGIARQYI